MHTNAAISETAVSSPNQLSNRLVALDLARLLAMVMMIQGHTIYALASPEVVDVNIFPWNIWHFLRGITAPVFLTVSGAVHVFANKRDSLGNIPKKTVRRRVKIALVLVFIGYLMVFPAQKVWDLLFVDAHGWTVFFRVNILQLFGVSLLLLLLLFIFIKDNKKLGITALIIGLAITFISPLMQKAGWFSILPEPFAAYLSFEKGSLFPAFPFASYLFFGCALGTFLSTMDADKRTWFIIKWGMPVGLLLIGAGYLFNKSVSSGFFYHTSSAKPSLTLIRLGFVSAGLSVISIAYLGMKRFSKIFSMLGKRALFIYVAHLILIYGCAMFPGLARISPRSLSLGESLIAVLIIESLALFSAFFYEYTTTNYPKSRKIYACIAAGYVIVVLFI